jgi:hypothetical protein
MLAGLFKIKDFPTIWSVQKMAIILTHRSRDFSWADGWSKPYPPYGTYGFALQSIDDNEFL